MKAQRSAKGRVVLFRPDANADRMIEGAPVRLGGSLLHDPQRSAGVQGPRGSTAACCRVAAPDRLGALMRMHPVLPSPPPLPQARSGCPWCRLPRSSSLRL